MMELAWTSKESIAIDMIMDLIGECRFNRTYQEYIDIGARLPKIETAFVYVNARLKKLANSGQAPYEICPFKKGDCGHYYLPYPTSLSRETVRRAIKKYRDQVAELKRLLSA